MRVKDGVGGIEILPGAQPICLTARELSAVVRAENHRHTGKDVEPQSQGFKS